MTGWRQAKLLARADTSQFGYVYLSPREVRSMRRLVRRGLFRQVWPGLYQKVTKS